MFEIYGEDKYVVMFGGFYIEIAVFKVVGEFLDGSGWVNVFVNVDIVSFGIVELFLKVSYFVKVRRVY